ncbi:variant leucine-rich repeat-containing protein [Arthrobacter sp. ATA002]|uniref:variant leucine-rich repeat-containing protein n=1 Tax=Arthrobacter sp. ATA002 TaxID=2991715 RepID=UPI003FA44470
MPAAAEQPLNAGASGNPSAVPDSDAASADLLTEAADPQTPLARLQELAANHPHTRPAVAANPSTYPGLLTWLGQLDDPAVDQALRQRSQ